MQGVVRLNVIDQYLELQHELSAVECFAQKHASGRIEDTGLYRDLIPLTGPGPGQQLAFEVDLDACTGCKACVTACHRMNGLDREEAETWRSVGLLHGGTPEQPLQQTVTTACHHCLDPACLKGCPVNAYEKDPATGIVKHLDDQCIGCQYCTLTCPYEVPQYSKKRGIVRKCDMCSDRLSSGEAPACVQACPNEAIRIRTIDCASALEEAQTDAFLPGAPASNITVPTTRYVSKRPLPRNLLPADFYSVRDSARHRPLVAMLVLMQLSVGVFLADLVCSLARLDQWYGEARAVQVGFGLLAGIGALAAGTFHLGRPLYAFRAVIGFKRSWFSREVVAFGAFAALSGAQAALTLGQHYDLLAFMPPPSARVSDAVSFGVAAIGLAGVVCSIMLYHVTGRRWWSVSRTGFRFVGTTLVLGLAASLALASLSPGPSPLGGSGLALLLCVLVLTKLAGELGVFVHLSDKRLSDLKRTALLLKGPLAKTQAARVALSLVGGALLTACVLNAGSAAATLFALIGAVLLVAGEMLERTLFFRAVSSPRMPGSIAQ